MNELELREKQLESLQNMANNIGAKVHFKYETDKRKKVNMFHVTIDEISLGPIMDYKTCNHFLLGACLVNGYLNKKQYSTLPSCQMYAEYLKAAQNKFNITNEEARSKYGSYTINQWNQLLK
jgi:hypothetical protein